MTLGARVGVNAVGRVAGDSVVLDPRPWARSSVGQTLVC